MAKKKTKGAGSTGGATGRGAALEAMERKAKTPEFVTARGSAEKLPKALKGSATAVPLPARGKKIRKKG